MAEPAVCNDRDPRVPDPRGTRSVSELTSLIWSGEGRVVALAVHAGAGEHAGGAVVVHFDRTELDVQTDRGGDLHVRRQADAHGDRIVGGATLCLLGAELFVTRRGQHSVEGFLVLAGVVGSAGVSGHRERTRLDEVLAADLSGIHPDLPRSHVDDPLDQLGGFGPACATVRTDRGRVGHDATGGELHLLDVVHADAHHLCEHRQDCADRRV